MNSAAHLTKQFKHEVEDVVARLQVLNCRDVGFRFEVGVPVECAFEALFLLEKRALDDEDFFLLRAVATLLGTSACFNSCIKTSWIAGRPVP
jgi:hypothetical protein